MHWNAKVGRQFIEPEIMKEIFEEKERLYNDSISEIENSEDSWITWDWEIPKIPDSLLKEYMHYVYLFGAAFIFLCVMVAAHLILSYTLLRKTQANEKKERERSLETHRDALLLEIDRRQNDHID